jgi:hypothetical protein
MLAIRDLGDNLLYVESENWNCCFGHGDPVKLGLVLEAIDLGGDDEDGFSYIIDANLLPQPEYLDEEILAETRCEGIINREEQIRYAYEIYGGVPVNIDAVQPSKSSCGFSSFVAESSIRSMQTESGQAMDVRYFQDLEEAMRFARDFYAVYAPVIFGFIDIVLDNPLRAGGTGWDKIRQMSKK